MGVGAQARVGRDIRADGGFYKIGRSKDPEKRAADFSSLPFNIELLHTITTDDPGWLENAFHAMHAHCHAKGEWYKLTQEEVDLFLKTAGIQHKHLVGDVVPVQWGNDKPSRDGQAVIQARVAPALYDAIASLATANHRSKNSELVVALESHLKILGLMPDDKEQP